MKMVRNIYKYEIYICKKSELGVVRCRGVSVRCRVFQLGVGVFQLGVT